MKIYEVTFKDSESSRITKKKFFSSKTDQDGFIVSSVGSLFGFKKTKHEIGRNKSDIIKFLNKENNNV